jgi:hypothetical protein
MEKLTSEPGGKRPQKRCAETEKITESPPKSAESETKPDIGEDKTTSTEAAPITNAILDFNNMLFGNFKY